MSRYSVPKIGTGTEDDPYRPDLSAIDEIVQLHKILDVFRRDGREIQNKTFYIVQVVRDLGNEFEVEIIPGRNVEKVIDPKTGREIEVVVERTISEWIEELRKWQR